MANESAKGRVLQLNCFCEKKQFTNEETKEKFDYLSMYVVIDGQNIPLSIPKESKQLLKYLLMKKFD